MPNYLSAYDAETLPRFGDCVKINGGRVYFTPIGIRRYRERFARVGFDVADIVTVEDLQLAIESSWHIELECFRKACSERPLPADMDPLERKFLLARRRGDDAEAARIVRLVERRASLGLSLVAGPATPGPDRTTPPHLVPATGNLADTSYSQPQELPAPSTTNQVSLDNDIRLRFPR